MRCKKSNLFILLLALFLPASWGGVYSINAIDNHGHIQIKESQVQGTPKTSSIQATIDGHYLTVAFTNNIGHVTVEVSEVNGGESQVESTPTPNGVIFYIVDTGSYIVTFTFSDGDIYYGEFEVID